MALDWVALISLILIAFIFFVIPKRLQAIASIPLGQARHTPFGASIKLGSFWGLAIIGGVGYIAAIGISTNLVLFIPKTFI